MENKRIDFIVKYLIWMLICIIISCLACLVKFPKIGDFFNVISIAFIVVSFVTILSSRSKRVYWEDLVNYSMIHPKLTSVISYSAYIFSSLTIIVFLEIFDKLELLSERIYNSSTGILFIVVLVLISCLCIKLLLSYFGTSTMKKSLYKNFNQASDKEKEKMIMNLISNTINYIDEKNYDETIDNILFLMDVDRFSETKEIIEYIYQFFPSILLPFFCNEKVRNLLLKKKLYNYLAFDIINKIDNSSTINMSLYKCLFKLRLELLYEYSFDLKLNDKVTDLISSDSFFFTDFNRNLFIFSMEEFGEDFLIDLLNIYHNFLNNYLINIQNNFLEACFLNNPNEYDFDDRFIPVTFSCYLKEDFILSYTSNSDVINLNQYIKLKYSSNTFKYYEKRFIIEEISNSIAFNYSILFYQFINFLKEILNRINENKINKIENIFQIIIDIYTDFSDPKLKKITYFYRDEINWSQNVKLNENDCDIDNCEVQKSYSEFIYDIFDYYFKNLFNETKEFTFSFKRNNKLSAIIEDKMNIF